MIIAIIIQICERDISKNHLPSQMKSCLPVRWKTQASSLSAAAIKEGKRGCSSRQENSPILNCGMKGVGADTTHHRSDLVLNIRLGARIFIYVIFLKTKGTPVNNFRHVD